LGISNRKVAALRRDILEERRSKKAFPMKITTLGDLFRVKRGERHLTQKQVAAVLKVRYNEVSAWETDKAVPSDEQMAILRGLLGIEVSTPPQKPNT
jgi:DNA-binding transcriptional regulator YiaG